MEIQAESLEITTNILENIDIPVERVKESIPTIRANTNKWSGYYKSKATKKRNRKSEAIYTEMVEKEIDKPSQVGESQLSLTTIVAMLGVKKEWEDVTNWFLIDFW